MTKNGTLKTLIVITLVVLDVIFGGGANTHYPIIIAILPPFFFGIIVSLTAGLVAPYVKKLIVVKPQWNDSILSFHKPLSIIQFCGYLLIAIGITQQLSQWFKENDFRQVGILIGFLGVGLILGIWLIIKFRNNVGNSA